MPAKKLVIEVDGYQHKEPGYEEYDKLRTNYLKSLGLKVARFWNNDIDSNLDGVILKIENYL